MQIPRLSFPIGIQTTVHMYTKIWPFELLVLTSGQAKLFSSWALHFSGLIYRHGQKVSQLEGMRWCCRCSWLQGRRKSVARELHWRNGIRNPIEMRLYRSIAIIPNNQYLITVAQDCDYRTWRLEEYQGSLQGDSLWTYALLSVQHNYHLFICFRRSWQFQMSAQWVVVILLKAIWFSKFFRWTHYRGLFR